jgi:glycosyltransferase involved in cell wall biosynthesis
LAKKKILYIQHAGALGGSCMSLLYTMQGLDRSRFEPVVALARPSPELVDFYARAGFEVLPWPGMVLWDHSTVAPMPLYDPRSWLHLWQVWWCWGRTQRRTLKLIDAVQPDIVHLNSMPLSPCADILGRKGIPFVWHVREPPPNQGLRTRLIRRVMLQAQRLIFISEYDRQAWVEGRAGDIVCNFVDTQTFHPKVDGVSVRKTLGLKPDDNGILYLGGIAAANGILVLLKALALLCDRLPNLVCLMPGSEVGPSASWKGRFARKVLPLVRSGTLAQKVVREIRVHGLEPVVRLLPFSRNIPGLLAACDVLVFPATQPHFARPVVEAAATGKPSVGSDLGGVNELIEHEHTGLLVEPGSPAALAEALKKLLTNPDKLKTLGENALIKARKEFEAKQQVAKITQIYDLLLGRKELRSLR